MNVQTFQDRREAFDFGRTNADVCLVYMPFGPIERPSLALGILKAALVKAGVPTRVLYPSFDFAERIGSAPYAELAWVREENIGEWVFSAAAFPDFVPDNDRYLSRVTGLFAHNGEAAAAARARAWLLDVRRQAVDFVEEVARKIVAGKPKIVGCTSTFQQHCAVLALTRRIKELDPGIVTILGGANCEAEMGVATALEFPWVDLVVSGEAEGLFPGLCKAILDNGLGSQRLPPGVLGDSTRRHPDPYRAPPRAIADLDTSPLPDFDDYFTALHGYERCAEIKPALMIESSRGCWWGAIKHCTFCGLNGGSMAYRFKPADRVLDELDELNQRYGIDRFLVVDNILPLDYFDTLLPELAKRGAPYHLFYEIKANLNFDQLRLLRDAGVTWLQPGIESFHDGALKLMDKGTPAWNNIQLLKWARELGMTLTWNYLCGFPGEDDAWYSEVAGWIPQIAHLQPSRELRPIRIDRFSPYHQRPKEYGIDLEVNWAYHYIYPLEEDRLARLVYIFHSSTESDLSSSPFRVMGMASANEFPSLGSPGRDALQSRLREWHSDFLAKIPPILSMRESDESTQILDTRSVAHQRRLVLEGLEHRVHRTLHGARTLASIVKCLDADGGPAVDAAELSRVLDDLAAKLLVMKIGGRYLALAIPGEIPALPKCNEEGYPGGWISRGAALPKGERTHAYEGAPG
jgi:ribosomal peptide maturation radical SAM protein 1